MRLFSHTVNNTVRAWRRLNYSAVTCSPAARFHAELAELRNECPAIVFDKHP
jgi:hypothetical protein